MSAQRPLDAGFLIVTLVLTGIGIVMVFSASSAVAYVQFHDAAYYLKRELLWAGVGACAFYAGARLDYRRLRLLAPWIFGAAVVLLGAVLVSPVGFIEGGARRWLALGIFTFEPSEVAKLALVVMLAHLFSLRREGARSFARAGFPALLCVGLCFALVMREPDLGTASLYLVTAFVMLFAAGARPSHLALEAAVAVPAMLEFIYASPYRRARFLAFLDPWKDPQGTGYHIIQSLYALGSGRWLGLGLGESRQKFGYLPAQHTDFIFAIIGEELGFIGALAVLTLFVVFAYRGIRIALRAEDRFGFHLAFGLTVGITLQALMNVAVVSGSWPITGVPLPFISYGGTSLVMTLFSAGLIAGVSRGPCRPVTDLACVPPRAA